MADESEFTPTHLMTTTQPRRTAPRNFMFMTILTEAAILSYVCSGVRDRGPCSPRFLAALGRACATT